MQLPFKTKREQINFEEWTGKLSSYKLVQHWTTLKNLCQKMITLEDELDKFPVCKCSSVECQYCAIRLILPDLEEAFNGINKKFFVEQKKLQDSLEEFNNILVLLINESKCRCSSLKCDHFKAISLVKDANNAKMVLEDVKTL
jgi:hypothetical protein